MKVNRGTLNLPQIPGYELKKRLGKGGMGSVYLAQRMSDGKELAIKIVNESVQQVINSALKKRFLREIAVCKSFAHPNVVMLIDGSPGGEGKPAYFASEYLPGADLLTIGQKGSVSPEKVTDYIRQLCEGLTYIHSQGYVHRDIKPANIIVTPQGRVVLVDFGLVYDAELTRLTATSEAVGTFAYLAPEQLSGEEVDERTDIYQLGATFYWLLTGEHPYTYDEIVGLVTNKKVSSPPKPHEVVPEIPKKLSLAIMKAIATKKEERFQSAEKLKKHLFSADKLKASAAQKQRLVLTLIALFSVLLLYVLIGPMFSGKDWQQELSQKRQRLLLRKELPSANELIDLGELVQKTNSLAKLPQSEELSADILGHLYLVHYCMERRPSELLRFLLPLLETNGTVLGKSFPAYYAEAEKFAVREKKTKELVSSMRRFHEWSPEDPLSALYFAIAIRTDFLARIENTYKGTTIPPTIEEGLKVLRPIVRRDFEPTLFTMVYLQLLRRAKTVQTNNECKEFMEKLKRPTAELLHMAAATLQRSPRGRKRRKVDLDASYRFSEKAIKLQKDPLKKILWRLELVQTHALRERTDEGKAILQKISLEDLPLEEKWHYFHAKADVHWKANEFKLAAKAFKDAIRFNPPEHKVREFKRRATEAQAQATIFIGR